MRKTVFLTLMIMLAAMSGAYIAYAEDNKNNDFEADGIQYKITVPAEKGINGEAMVVGYDDNLTKLIIPSEVSYKGIFYRITSINFSYGKDENMCAILTAPEIEIPASVNNILDSIWDINGSVESITFRCPSSAIKTIRFLHLAPYAIAAVAYVPEDEIDEYTAKLKSDTLIEFAFGGDIYERILQGITIATIGEKDVIPDRFHEEGLFFEVIDKKNLHVRLIGATLEEYVFSEEVCETGVYTVPETAYYKGREYTVTSLGSHCLCEANCIIKMPETITEIEPEVFGEDVTGIYMSNSITEIPENMFDEGENWPSLTYIKLSENLKSIPRKAFYRCLKLRGIVIPESVTEIGSKAFRKNVKTVYIKGSLPKNIKNIMGYMKNTTFYAEEKYVDALKQEMASKIAAGKAKVKASKFKETSSFEIIPETINVSELSSLQFKVLRDKGADGKTAWFSNAQNVVVSQSGKCTYDRGYIDTDSGIYAFDILSGKYVFIRFEE